MSISEKIKGLRIAKGLKQSDLARELDIETSNYNRFENRGNKLTIEQAERIAEALGVTLGELLGIQDCESVMSENARLVISNENLSRNIDSQDDRISELTSRISDKDLIIKSLSKETDNIKQLFNVYIDYIKLDIEHKYLIGTITYMDKEGHEHSVLYNSLSEKEADDIFDIDGGFIELELDGADEEQILNIMFKSEAYGQFVAFLVSTGLVENEDVLRVYKQHYPEYYGHMPYFYYEYLKSSGRKLVDFMKSKDIK